ncbi:MAG TPA: c-type cytochrome domain-containing protein [Isosphaeraceae bacterium]|nr:c-type cytochrome domain-containing protein [Isosphaeraceae bacterium]
MMCIKLQNLAAAPIAALILVQAALGSAEDAPTYERDIRPLFAKRCTVCHNARKVDDPDLSGGLALDGHEAVLRGSKEHRVIVPGTAEQSELYRRICEEDEDRRMPLFEKPLAEPERALIKRWIDAGVPRGEPSTAVAAMPKRPIRRALRSLDVIVPTEAKVPKETRGMESGGTLEVALKVGPLPAVSALAFRGDGRQLAVGTYGAVVVWDLADARPAIALQDIPGPVHALAFSRDGRRLAVGSGMPAQSGSVRVYTVPDGTLELDLEGHGDVVYALAFRPDGAQLASAGFDQTVRLWSLINGRLEGVFHGHSDFVYEVAYLPDGRTLLSASKDRSIKRFDGRTVKGIRTFSDHDDDVLALAVRPDGTGFVSAGNEPQLRWWTLDGEKPHRKVGGHAGPVHQLCFSGDGKRLISASGDKSIRLWDGSTGIFQRSLPGPTDWQYAVALSHDAHLAAAGGWDGLVRVWDADAGKLLGTLLQPLSQSPGATDWLAIAPSGHIAASQELLPLLRWRLGGAEVAGDAPARAFIDPGLVARSLQGEPIASPFVAASPSAK